MGDFYLCGIDPGLTGAFAHVHVRASEGTCQMLEVHDMPTADIKVGRSTKAHLILSAIPDLIRSPFHLTDHVTIEEVSAAPGQGVTSMFRFGYVAGVLAGITTGLNIPLSTIRPQRWQQMLKLRSGDDPRLAASRLFPGHAHLLTRKKDHNRADAMLIAYAQACLMSDQLLRPVHD